LIEVWLDFIYCYFNTLLKFTTTKNEFAPPVKSGYPFDTRTEVTDYEHKIVQHEKFY